MRSIVVVEDFGDWTAGSTIHSDAHIVKYHRDMLATISAANPDKVMKPLSDAELLTIVDSVVGDTTEATEERLGRLMAGDMPAVGTQPTVVAPQAGEPATLGTRGQESAALAAKAAASPQFVQTINGMVEIYEKTKLAPRIVRDALEQAIGRDGMDSLPRAGTTIDGRSIKRDGVDVPTIQANNYDWYWVDGYTARGRKTAVRHSYIEDFAKSFPAWTTLQTAIDALDSKADEHGAKRQVRNLTYRQGVVVKMFRDAIALDQQLQDLSGYAGCKWSWQDEKDGVACFRLQDSADLTKLGHWTISEMMQFDVHAARGPQKKPGMIPGSYAALIETTTREPKTPAGEQITTIVGKNFYPSVLEMDKFLMGSDNYAWAQGEARAKLPNGELKPEAVALITALHKLTKMVEGVIYQNDQTTAVINAAIAQEKAQGEATLRKAG